MNLTARQLEQKIRAGIPLATDMDFRVRELRPDSIRVLGGGPPNVNVHGSAFAGSLYALCTLALWGLVYSRLPENASLVLAQGEIRYRRPVVGDIVVTCTIPAPTMTHCLRVLADRGRARLTASAQVPGEDGPAALFEGTVHARLL